MLFPICSRLGASFINGTRRHAKYSGCRDCEVSCLPRWCLELMGREPLKIWIGRVWSLCTGSQRRPITTEHCVCFGQDTLETIHCAREMLTARCLARTERLKCSIGMGQTNEKRTHENSLVSGICNQVCAMCENPLGDTSCYYGTQKGAM